MKEKRNAFMRIDSDGNQSVTWLKNADANKPLELKWLQSAVGGCIEVVRFATSKDYAMVVDEEGRLKDHKYNKAASTLCGEPLCGPAVPVIIIGEEIYALTADEAQIFSTSLFLSGLGGKNESL